ncbi:hypothetical protein [Streptomyces boncukensis]|uniref:Uncharacterized protein n=1 Tax=Streptomyces boncukensis TaxID=2711219 RepID=A0A6G4X2D2_9ACTN|nr:hypothetical protein [Streptomyces boncukensis]NGO71040.1 hypothetical protein [Streptomyces boncukensis]
MNGGTPFTGPWVTDSRGPVHAGQGDLYVQILQEAGIDVSRPGPDPRQVTDDELARLARRFVPPGHLAQAHDTLQTHRIALVTGDSGSGRRCAALMLLDGLPRSTGRFHELLDRGEDGGGRALDPGDVGDGDRLLLDLVHLARERRDALLRELGGFMATVRERNGYLSVVLPPDREFTLSPELFSLAVRIVRPPARDVLFCHLREEGIRADAGERGEERLTQFLERASMERVGTLAVHIRRARQYEGEGAGFGSWLTTALTALSPTDTEIAERLRQAGDGRQRALLLAAAFLYGARADAVSHAADELVTQANHPAVATPPLAHEPLATRLHTVGASIRDGGRVFLRELDRDRTVRAHGWDNFPALRPALYEWVARIAAGHWLTRDESTALVTRFTEQWLRTEPPEPLGKLARRWAGDSSPRTGRPAAAQLLRDAVVHERHGGWFRHQLYDWACNSTLDPGLAHVLVGVCATDMLARYPDQAMIRLRHLACHQQPSVRKAAHVALAGAVREDDRLYRRLLERLRPGPAPRAAADAELFLHVAEPARLVTRSPRAGPLIASPALRDQFAVLWGSARDRAPREHWAGRELDWFDTAAAEGPHSALLLDVLADSCGADTHAVSRLYVAARDWAAGSPAGRRPAAARTVNRLQNSARAALGIGLRRPSV